MSQLERYKYLDDFLKFRMKNDIYPEEPQSYHADITKEMVGRLSKWLDIQGKSVLDAGCGQGVALEIFTNLGAKPIGVTLGKDYEICKDKGFDVYECDQSFLDFPKESFDLVWCRHALEHSIFPLFTLNGFCNVLRPGGILYVEVPAPETAARHELNPNHYSCFTKDVWYSLFMKSDLKVLDAYDIKFKIPLGDDCYHCFYLTKA